MFSSISCEAQDLGEGEPIYSLTRMNKGKKLFQSGRVLPLPGRGGLLRRMIYSYRNDLKEDVKLLSSPRAGRRRNACAGRGAVKFLKLEILLWKSLSLSSLQVCTMQLLLIPRVAYKGVFKVLFQITSGLQRGIDRSKKVVISLIVAKIDISESEVTKRRQLIYRKLVSLRKLLPNTPLLAFTATTDPTNKVSSLGSCWSVDSKRHRSSTATTLNAFSGILTGLPKPGGGEFGKFYSLPTLNDPSIGNILIMHSRFQHFLIVCNLTSCRILSEFFLNLQSVIVIISKEDVEKIIDWEKTAPKQAGPYSLAGFYRCTSCVVPPGSGIVRQVLFQITSGLQRGIDRSKKVVISLIVAKIDISGAQV
ncbi:hypothetical protein QVD17_34756 [Tagetes erecta]|uniref:Uncharacterized protein n=1 Tax=Tagetes erecta TaxID=13708 RepID=A0AAD8NM13_TARER|nr:hypothetical protein QVD17_34756 [Tagetes erecta]